MSRKIVASKSVNFLMMISLTSKALGFLRDIVLTYFWGANSVSDAFIIAITVPGTVCDLLIQAIAVGFIPTYTEIVAHRTKKDGDFFTISFIELLLVCCLPIICFMGFRPDLIIKIFASGFNEETNNIAALFIRITASSILFKMIVSVLAGYLQSNKQYVVPAFIGIPYDIVIIIGIVLSYYVNKNILPFSVIVAGFVQAIVLMTASARKGLNFRVTSKIITDDTKSVLQLLLPLLIIVGANQINVIIDRTFASYVQTGAITILDYANKICLMIENIVVFSIVAILYPELGKDSATKDEGAFASHLKDASSKIIRYLVPTSVYIMMLAYPIVAVLFGRGAFSDSNVNDTAQCMMFYSIGIVFVALRTIYTRALYAIKKVRSVTIISIITLFINALLNAFFVKLLGLRGLALATSIANIVTTIAMFCVLYKNNRGIRLTTSKSLMLAIVSSVAQFVFVLALSNVFFRHDGSKFHYVIGLTIQGIILGTSVLVSDKLAKQGKRN